jgi:hypothetical protein
MAAATTINLHSFLLGSLASSVVVLVSVASKHCKKWWRNKKLLMKAPAITVPPPPSPPKKHDRYTQTDNSEKRSPACQAAFELLSFIDQSGSSLAPLVRMSDQDRVQQERDQAAELASLHKRWTDSRADS